MGGEGLESGAADCPITITTLHNRHIASKRIALNAMRTLAGDVTASAGPGARRPPCAPVRFANSHQCIQQLILCRQLLQGHTLHQGNDTDPPARQVDSNDRATWMMSSPPSSVPLE